MAEGIVFLDVDDEITSAASRIRSAPGTKVALVVPNGSRIATSRINFRLLSREALVSNRRLSVIAADAATRALAASAGLPVFATIGEYEGAIARPKAAESDDVAAPRAAVSADEADTVPATEETPPIDATPEPPRRGTKPAIAAALAAAQAAPNVVPDETQRMAAPTPPTRPTDKAPSRDRDDTRPPVTPSRSRIRAPIVAAIAAIALAVVVAGAAAYLLLPSASIALTPRHDSIEIPLTIAADPTVTEVDAANGVVPALRLEVPVQASQTFTTTGRHVELSPATGSVEFSNYDPTSSNSVPAGSIVSTERGIRFRTLATVRIPAGTFVLPSVIPSKRSVDVEAVRDGPAGNVAANSIRAVPPGENPDFLKVNNLDATSGGVRTETPEVTKAEVDKAVAALTKDLQASFTDAIAAGAGAPAGTELFPTTATLGARTFTVDPTSLIGKAVESFDLEVAAKGSVTAVDPSPIQAIAEARLRERIGADHRLVNGSMNIDIAKGSVGEDGQVTFEATATAARVLVVDPSQLRALVKGRTASDAAAALAPYGEATVSLWPSWVTTVTGVDARLSISVDEQAGSGGPGASSSASPRSSPSARPSGAGRSGQPSKPAGSAAP